ncbi:NAD(P)-binding domain-containing protein [Flavihumibacter sp. CACIAM 22H1]|uniref:NAD(P)-dependent oxidoreductase n=1 Tax=Flavihumibacter sp. CACIAM 22H1 TaxID=1812911 RepID=UPI0007A85FA2|nr:NAD(P)-binding domain-containing protein [Flavihumibacter sp. CACIAM 22H1]KYP13747.1 MAG: 6-phosphogluconate dehydrogenase [Flavihumibacter sp. CACIAM 22H1]
MIAFLGTGLLGSNFTKALLRKGEKLHVWNRSAEKAAALEAEGAIAFRNIQDAVRGVERIHLTLSDDASVDAVLASAEAALQPGCFILDHTTTTVQGAIDRTNSWAAKGMHYVHVPVFMGPANALESTGVMLVSGDAGLLQLVMPMIRPMTGQVINYGLVTGRAAAIKLMGNSFLITMTTGIADMLAIAKSMDIPNEAITQLFDNWNAGATAPTRLARMLSGKYDQPSWELQMSRKDARLMLEVAAQAGKHLAVLPACATEMDRWLEKGMAQKDWTIIGSDHV